MRIVWIVALLCLAAVLVSAPVSQSQAELVARNWLSMKTQWQGELTTQSHDGLWIVSPVGGGFVLVSADDAAYPIIGWSSAGTFDVNTGNPAMRDYLASVRRQMLAIEEHRTTNAETRPVWDAILRAEATQRRLDRDVEPMITSHWRQSWPYNAMCPEDANGPHGHVYVGCCATAAAQLMRYWQHPVNGVGSHSYVHGQYGTISADFAAATYVWEDMPDTLSDYNEEVAEICFHAGVAMDMGYSSGGSGANFETVFYALTTHFSYNTAAQVLPRYSYPDDEWDAMVREELDAGRPVYYLASEENGTGHAFLIDGYDDPDHFHVNWGWGGNCDGYFYFSNLAPGSHDFTYSQSAFFDLYPVEPSEFAAPTGLVADVTDNDVHLCWTPPINDEGQWLWYQDQMEIIFFNGPERAIKYCAADFSLAYPIVIQQVQHYFYDHVQNPWGDNDQFVVKIYDADGVTLLYESAAQTAQRMPTITTHVLAQPLTVTDDFYISIRPLDEETYNPSSTAGSYSGTCHSWYGEPGSWQLIDNEWLTGVNITEQSTGRQLTLYPEPTSRMLLGYNIQRDGTNINPLWLIDPEYDDENLDAGTYIYTVTAVYDLGESNVSNSVSVHIGTSTGEDIAPAEPLTLSVFPNPFNPETTVSFTLTEPARVSLDVFNIRGQKVRTLQQGHMEAGAHTVVWHGDDDNGVPCASGLYLMQLNADANTVRGKVILLK